MPAKTKTPIAPTKPQGTGCSFLPQKTLEVLSREFIAAQLASAKKKERGQENYINDMASVLVPFCASYQNATHSVNEFALFCRHLDLPFIVIENFYADFIAALRAEHRVRQIETCYDGVQHVFC